MLDAYISWFCVEQRALVSSCILAFFPVILSRFGRYFVPRLLTPTFRKHWCWFWLGATLCHDVLRCCQALATPEPRYCPALTHLTSDTSLVTSCYAVSRYGYVVASQPPRFMLCHVVLRNILVSVLGYINLVTPDSFGSPWLSHTT